MRKLKYVILAKFQERFFTYTNFPLIFPEEMSHALVASRNGGQDNIVSAGFCTLESLSNYPRTKESINRGTEYCEEGIRLLENRWICYGQSDSLGIKSRVDEDQKILDKYYR